MKGAMTVLVTLGALGAVAVGAYTAQMLAREKPLQPVRLQPRT